MQTRFGRSIFPEFGCPALKLFDFSPPLHNCGVLQEIPGGLLPGFGIIELADRNVDVR